MRENKLMPILWVLLLIMCPAHVYAQATSGYCGRQVAHNTDSTNLQWNYDAAEHVLTISGAGPMKDYDTDTKAPWYAWRNEIQRVVTGDSVTSVGTYALYQVAMGSVSFGYRMDSIGQNALTGCNYLDSVYWNVRNYPDPQLYIHAPLYPLRSQIRAFVFGDLVEHIPSYLCHSMDKVQHLHIAKSVSSIGDYAFRYMNNLDSISVDAKNQFYDSRNDCNALIESSTDKLLIGCSKTRMPDGLRGIDDCAFRKVRGLTEAIIPQSVTFIGKEAFNGCADLDSLVLPSQLKSIEDYTFQDCSSLDSVVLPEQLKSMGIRAFANCSGLRNISLPETLDSMAQYTFSGCSSLQYINSYAVVPPTIHQTSFDGIRCPIYVPCPSLNAYRNAPIWEDFGDEEETPEGPKFVSRIKGMFDWVLTVLSNNDEWGTVTIVQEPDCETNAVVRAEARMGYDFVEWQDAQGRVVPYAETEYEFYVDEDVTLTAIFRQNTEDVMVLMDRDSQGMTYDILGRPIGAGAASAPGVYVKVVNGQPRKVMIQ